MPRLWTDTIDAHRREVSEAIIESTAELVSENGLRGVTMSQIAERVGIGRATLYKYFSNVEAILVAWHRQQITAHLHHLAVVRDQAEGPVEKLRAVLEAYALISFQHDGSELAALVHRDEHVDRARDHLREFLRDLVADGARSGDLRRDIAVDELASYCLHAVSAAEDLRSKAAVRRLVGVVLDGLR